MDQEIETLQNEVDQLAQRIEEICKTDTEVNELYKGTHIYLSPLKEQMDLMFIGINPGAGSFNHCGVKPHNVTPPEKSEFETEEYQLQNEWKTIFGPSKVNSQNQVTLETLNNLDLLYNGFKTNCSFIATEDSSQLKKLKTRLKYQYKIDLDKEEKRWIQTLIGYVDPKLIICEGFEAFSTLQNMYAADKFIITEQNSPTKKIAYLNSYLPVLGFKRNHSIFCDIQEVADTISEFLEE